MEDLEIIKFAALAAFLIFFFVMERMRPFAPKVHKKDRVWRNAGLWLSVMPVSPLFVVPISLWATQHALWDRPDWWSGWQGVLIDIILLDLWIYWMHRTFHIVPFFWRFHEIHHRDETLDATSAVRFHFGEVMISASVRMAFIILLALPFYSIIIFETIAALSAIFQHSNLKMPKKLEQFLSYVIVTPSIHWIHHHQPREDTNSNYCNIFSWWDLLFGTRSKTVRSPDLPIGLDYTTDLSFMQLLLQPFKRRR